MNNLKGVFAKKGRGYRLDIYTKRILNIIYIRMRRKIIEDHRL